MLWRRYELRFITQHGIKIRGPVIKRKDWQKFADKIQDIQEATVFRMRHNGSRIVIPQQTLENGHFHLKPVGPIYWLIRLWRSW
jgi:hypothetical protein